MPGGDFYCNIITVMPVNEINENNDVNLYTKCKSYRYD